MGTRRMIVLPRFGTPDVLVWEDRPLPVRRPDEYLVRVEAIGVDFADTMVRRGEYRRDQPLTFIPGFECAGRVLAGPEGGCAPGTRVAVFMENGGAYADHVVAPQAHVYPVLDGLDLPMAAGLFAPGVTAHYAVHRFGRVAEGTRVLVTAAAGGVGSLAVQLAAAAGAEVIAVASTQEKLELAAGHGARHGVLADPETLTAQIRELTGGDGVQLVIDGVGGPLFAPCFRALAFNGHFIVVGSASQQPGMLDVRALLPRNQVVSGFVVARVSDDDPAEPAATFAEVQRLVLSGRLRPALEVLPHTEAARAHEVIESRRLTGKLALTFD